MWESSVGIYSDWFQIAPGVRQGGVLSPDLYIIYVDDLISILQSSGVGCHVRKSFAAALFYADDIAVLAPSLKGLQRLINICRDYCLEWDILMNAKKSKNLYFGLREPPPISLELGGVRIPWEKTWVYLGVTLRSGKVFDCCVKEKLAKFYGSLNAIIRVDGRSDDMVLLRLLEAHCLPILTYASEIVHVINVDDRRQLRVAYNAIYRKIFDYDYNESVELLQHSLGRTTWEELVVNKKENFLEKCNLWPKNSLVRALCSLPS